MNKEQSRNPWDQRYAVEEFHYGTEPNELFKKEIDKLKPGKLLLPAEGEGRNAVYAAKMGWEVVAFDSSIEGQKKAYRLAKEQGVEIDYQLKSYEEFESEENSFDMIAFIYSHNANRQQNHKKLAGFVKAGGKIILEGFSKEQLQYGTGGPPVLSLLYSEEEIKEDFEGLAEFKIEKIVKHLSEGKHHVGDSSIIQFIGKKI